MHSRPREADPAELVRDHDRDKHRLLAEDDPVFRALGLTDHQGRMKPSRQSKYRQVEEFLRILDASVSEALDKGHLRRPTPEQPLEIVDLGCGNAYLTFVTERYLTHVRGLPVHLTGIDQREQSREHNQRIAARARRRGELHRLVHLGGRAGHAARRRPRPARVRHRHRRRPGPRDRVAGAGDPGRALLPPRHRRPATAHADPRAVRHAHPARHPPRAVRRHPHRRPARVAAAAGGLPRRRHAVRRAASTRRATPCSARSTPAHRSTARPARSTTSWSPPGGSRPRLATLLGRSADARLGARARRRRAVRRRPGGDAGRAARHAGAALRRPGDHRGQRPGGRRRSVRDHQRLGRHRPGLRGRPAGPDGRGDALVGRADRRRGARAGRARCGLGRRHRRQPGRALRRHDHARPGRPG